MNTNDQTKLYNDIIDLLKHMNDYLKHFPKEEKYGLVLEIKRTGLDMVRLYVKCYKQYHNKTTKQELDVQHEIFRVMTRLAYEMHYFEFKDGVFDKEEPKMRAAHRYAVLQKKIDSIGRRIGGWLKTNPQ